MADFRAIMGVCEAVIRLLRSNYDPALFGNARADFEVLVSKDFSNRRVDEGISLFLYRVNPNGTHRTPAGQRSDGSVLQTKLPLDLHFLLTAWARTASMQHQLAGWMLRVMEDNPLLPSGLLNSPHAGVFRSDETVNVTLTDMSIDDMFHIWETMIQHTYELSVPYLARVVQLESTLAAPATGPVRTRDHKWGVLQRVDDATGASG